MAEMNSSAGYRNAEYTGSDREGIIVDLSEYAEQLVNYDDISHLLNDEQESSEDLVFEYRNLVDNIKTICKQSNSNFQSHLFEEQVQKTYLEHKNN